MTAFPAGALGERAWRPPAPSSSRAGTARSTTASPAMTATAAGGGEQRVVEERTAVAQAEQREEDLGRPGAGAETIHVRRPHGGEEGAEVGEAVRVHQPLGPDEAEEQVAARPPPPPTAARGCPCVRRAGKTLTSTVVMHDAERGRDDDERRQRQRRDRDRRPGRCACTTP